MLFFFGKIQVLTFLLDVRRFRYPERPVVFLSVCYFMVALAYVIGYAMGDSVSCNAPFDPPQDFSVDKADMVETITQVQYIKILKIATHSVFHHLNFSIGNETRILHNPLHVALLF